MKKTILRKYAHLIARCGVNVQEGQEVFINSHLEAFCIFFQGNDSLHDAFAVRLDADERAAPAVMQAASAQFPAPRGMRLIPSPRPRSCRE